MFQLHPVYQANKRRFRLFAATILIVFPVSAAHAQSTDILFLAGPTDTVSVVRPACDAAQPKPVTLILRTRRAEKATDQQAISNTLRFGARNITDKAPQFLDACGSYEVCGYRSCYAKTKFEVWHRDTLVSRGEATVSRDGSLMPDIGINSFETVQSPGPDDEFLPIIEDQEHLKELTQSLDVRVKAEALFLLGILQPRGSKEERELWLKASELDHRGATLNLFYFSPTSQTLSDVVARLQGNAVGGLSENATLLQADIFEGKPDQKELFERGFRLDIGPYVAFVASLPEYDVLLSGSRIVPLDSPPSKEQTTAILRRLFGRTMQKAALAGNSINSAIWGPLAVEFNCDDYWCETSAGDNLPTSRFSLFVVDEPECTKSPSGTYSCRMSAETRIRVGNTESTDVDTAFTGFLEPYFENRLVQVEGEFRRDTFEWIPVGPLLLVGPNSTTELLGGK